MPTVGEDGQFKPYQVPEIETVQRAVEQAVANVTLTLVCRACTREAIFLATDKQEALKRAREEGWVYYRDGVWDGSPYEFEICPQCSEERQG